MIRWNLNKLGFVNYWFFGTDEFKASNGCLILNGPNGSGKSIATQSAVPFLLEMDKRSTKWDATGTPDRKLSYYLTTCRHVDVATAYMYLEFIKPGLEQYTTLCIGLEQHGDKETTETWAFILNDGRRIGPDFRLYDVQSNGTKIAWSRQKLENLLGKDKVKKKRSEYQALINDALFGFSDLAQYTQLIDLLRALKHPRTASNIKISTLQEDMSNSLQPLTDLELKPLAETMTIMDSIETDMKLTSEALHASEILNKEFTLYNRLTLYRKATELQRQEEAVIATKQQLNEAEAAYQMAQEAVAQLTAEIAACEENLMTLRAKHDFLQKENEDVFTKEKNLCDLKSMYEQQLQSVALVQNQIDSCKTRIKKHQQELIQTAQDEQAATQNIHCLIARIGQNQISRLLPFEHAEFITAIQDNPNRNDREYQALRKSLTHLADRLRDAKRALEVLEQISKQLSDAHQACSISNAALLKAEYTLKQATDKLDNARRVYSDSMGLWISSNQAITFPPEDLISLQQLIAGLYRREDFRPIEVLLEARYNTVSRELTEEIHCLEAQGKLAEAQLLQAQHDLEDLRLLREIPPAQTDLTKHSRLMLLPAGIDYIEFYKAVDFAPNLSASQQQMIEAQLLSSGLLDTLIVNERDYETLRQNVEDFSDRFLIPGPAVEHSLRELLVPTEHCPFQSEVEACLSSISINDLSASMALLPDGNYQIGQLSGRIIPEAPVRFIGIKARIDYHAQLLAEKEAAVSKCLDDMKTLQDKLTAARIRKELALEEQTRTPSNGAVIEAFDSVADSQREYDFAESENQQRIQAMKEISKQHNAADLNARKATDGINLAYNLESYEDAIASISQYEIVSSRLQHEAEKLAFFQDRIQSEQDSMDLAHEEKTHAEKSMEDSQHILKETAAKIHAQEELLSQPNNQHVREIYANIKDTIDKTQATLEETRWKLSDQRAMLNRHTESIQTYQAQHERQLEICHRYQGYFLEDLQLGLVFDPSTEQKTTAEYCKALYQLIPTGQREVQQSKAEQNLISAFYNARTTLNASYNPQMDDPFDSPNLEDRDFRSHQVITMRSPRGDHVPLSDFVAIMREIKVEYQNTLDDKDRSLFEEVLSGNIVSSLLKHIDESKRWIDEASQLISTVRTGSGIQLAMRWVPKREGEGDTLNTRDFISLLEIDAQARRPEDNQRLAAHFRQQIQQRKEKALATGKTPDYELIIRDVLDYRQWYQFEFQQKKQSEDTWYNLTQFRFNGMSIGERGFLGYIPHIIAVATQYKHARKDAPLLMALDEAFVGIDYANREQLFSLFESLDFDYIINAHDANGYYPCVHHLNLYQLYWAEGTDYIASTAFHWDGRNKISLDEAITSQA